MVDTASDENNSDETAENGGEAAAEEEVFVQELMQTTHKLKPMMNNRFNLFVPEESMTAEMVAENESSQNELKKADTGTN